MVLPGSQADYRETELTEKRLAVHHLLHGLEKVCAEIFMHVCMF